MRKIMRHALLWIAIYVVYTYMMSYYDDLENRIVANLVNVPLFMLAYYILRYVQIPFLYNKGKLVLFGASLLLSTFIISSICRINGYMWMDEYFGRTEDIPFITMGAYLLKTVRYYTPAMALLAWESHQQRRKELERMQLLEKEKIATELKFLKAQINPHFLFNTLNNLYSFVLNQSPKAPDMIIRLSEILDYVLYKSQNKTVDLKSEILTIENFLELEKIRYGDRLKIDFNTNAKANANIAPLIFLSIVENAFKHGASGDIENPHITIDIVEVDSQVSCRVWNTKSKIIGDKNDNYKDGIGLSNIKRQLMLTYPAKHVIDISDKEDSFEVSVSINIKE